MWDMILSCHQVVWWTGKENPNVLHLVRFYLLIGQFKPQNFVVTFGILLLIALLNINCYFHEIFSLYKKIQQNSSKCYLQPVPQILPHFWNFPASLLDNSTFFWVFRIYLNIHTPPNSSVTVFLKWKITSHICVWMYY